VQQPDLAAAQFRSMLIDCFDRAYSEQKPFVVDRDGVARYMAPVHSNVPKPACGSILVNVAMTA